MSDLITLEFGAKPWAPTEDAEELVILDEHNIPLAGLLQQHGTTFLYVCAAGEEDDANVWIYSLVSDEEIQGLLDARGNDLLGAMKRAIQDRIVMIALADDWRLVDWDHFDAGTELPGVLVRRYLRRLSAKMRRRAGVAENLERDPSIADTALEQLAIAL